MAALGHGAGRWRTLAIAGAALAIALLAGREASRRSSGSPSLELLESGLDQVKSFLGDLIYLRIDDYHHIWMYQGHDWQEATDYLPMVWLVSRLKPYYESNYENGGYHLAVNLGKVEEGVSFLERGLALCPESLPLAWEYAVVLWRVEYATPHVRQQAVWAYLDLIRRSGGPEEEPWNEYNALMVLRELLEADSTRSGHDRMAALYGLMHRNRARLYRLRRAVEGFV